MNQVRLEICVESAAGAAEAIAGGCDRIELCSALALGGLTPSAGLVTAVLDIARPAGVPVYAMVRPQPGTFDYDAHALSIAAQEAAELVGSGVQGLVFGVTCGGTLDVAALRGWMGGLGEGRPSLTLHRAVDVVDDPVAAVDVAVALGFDRILTSGGAKSAPAGSAMIAAMVTRAAGRCSVIAGAGVAPDNVAALIANTGVREVHASASTTPPAGMEDRLGFGPPPRVTDRRLVERLRQAIDDKANLGQL